MNGAPLTCNPPAELLHKQWHWLRHPVAGLWHCSEVRDGKLWLGPGWVGAETAYRGGWRYHSPAAMPDEIEQLKAEADAILAAMQRLANG